MKNKIDEKFIKGFAENVIKKMEEIQGDWKKPWINPGGAGGWPKNLAGREYNGANALRLCFTSEMSGYGSGVWMTFNQAAENGVAVKKGEKSTPVWYYNIQYINKKEGKIISTKEYNGLSETEKGEYRSVPFLKWFHVFNADQTNIREVKPELLDKLEPPQKELPKDNTGKVVCEPMDRLIDEQSWICPIHVKEINDAYYSLTNKEINVPMKWQYESGEEYYMTTMHEMAHSTGDEAYLGRFKAGQGNGGFGSPEYGMEELVAEFSSSLAAVALGITPTISENNVAYLSAWIKTIKAEPTVLMDVLKDVNKATNMILEHVTRERERQENTSEERKTGEKAAEKNPLDGPTVKNAEEIAAKMARATQMAEERETIKAGSMLDAWHNIKDKHGDVIVLMRMRDHYVAFGEDAEKVARIAKTERIRYAGLDKGMLMTGFKSHALDSVLPNIIRQGERVAITDWIDQTPENKRIAKEIEDMILKKNQPDEVRLHAALIDGKVRVFMDGATDWVAEADRDRTLDPEEPHFKAASEDPYVAREIMLYIANCNDLTDDGKELLFAPIGLTKLQVDDQGIIHHLTSGPVAGGKDCVSEGYRVVPEMTLSEFYDLPDDTQENLNKIRVDAEENMWRARAELALAVKNGGPEEMAARREAYIHSLQLMQRETFNREAAERQADDIIQTERDKMKQNTEPIKNNVMEEKKTNNEEKKLKDGINIFKMETIGMYGINVVKDGVRSETHRLTKEDTQAYFDGLKGQPAEEFQRRKEALAAKYFAPKEEKKQHERTAAAPLPKIGDDVKSRLSEVSVFKMKDGVSYAVRGKVDGEQMGTTKISREDVAAFFEGYKGMSKEDQEMRRCELAAKYYGEELSQVQGEKVKSGLSR
jgi:antirestriction protein ArdC